MLRALTLWILLLCPYLLFFADASAVVEEDAHDTGEMDESDNDSIQPPTSVSYPMLFIFVSLLIGLATRFGLEKVKKKYDIRIPYSVVLLTFGGMLGAISWSQQRDAPSKEKWTISLTLWTHMNPRLILFIFLPALIYEGAMGTDYYVFKQQLTGGLFLAFPAMMLQVVLIAMVGIYSFPYGWGWTESLLFGGILSATDPVAVIALMKELNMLSDLRVLIEAESLLNDGTAIVVFELCHTILVHPSTVASYVGQAFQLTLAAPCLGSALFLACWWWLIKTDDPIQDTLVTVCTAYLGYFIGETHSISGVLTVLTIGVWMAGYGNTAIHTEHARHMLHAVWTVICYICDTIIFILAGAIIVQDGILMNNAIVTGSDIGYAFALYICLILIRGFVVLCSYPVLRYTGYGMQERVCSPLKFWKYMFVLTWGGLRGAVGLVLSMIVAQDTHLAHVVQDRDPHYCQRVILFTGIIVVLTTLLNAASLEKIIIGLGLGGGTETEEQLKKSAKRYLVRKHATITADFANRQNYPNLANVDWAAVGEMVGPRGLLSEHSSFHESDGSSFHEHDGIFSVMGAAWNAHHFLGRYLMSLRCSYSSQFKNGLMTPKAYRQLDQALKSAIDHSMNASDKALEDILAKLPNKKCTLEDLKFEWGWLEYEGFLDMPDWLEYLRTLFAKSKMMSSFVDRWIRYDRARRMEIMLAVTRAHEDTLRCELHLLQEAPESIRKIFNYSHNIKEASENRYAALQYEHPDIACAVRTRQTCQLMLLHMQEEVETLHETAQISDAEHEHYEHSLFHKRLHLTHVLPHVKGGSSGVNLLSYYFSQRDLDHFSKAELSVQEFAEFQTICHEQLGADSLYFIAHGMARVYKNAVYSSPTLAPGSNSKSFDRSQSQPEVLVGQIVLAADVQGSRYGSTDTDDPDGIAIAKENDVHPLGHGNGASKTAHFQSGSNGQVKQNIHNSFILNKTQGGPDDFLANKVDQSQVLLSAGCCFNDVEFLLDEGGFTAKNFGAFVAVTHVRLFRLKFSDLRSKPTQYLAFLERLWKASGQAMTLRHPELFNYMPPMAWDWTKVKLNTFADGDKLRFLSSNTSPVVLLIQGEVKQTHDQYFNVRTIITHKPFAFLMPMKGDTFTVSSETCKILCQEGDAVLTAKQGDEAVTMRGGLRRRKEVSMVERRSQELVRMPRLDKRLKDVTPQDMPPSPLVSFHRVVQMETQQRVSLDLERVPSSPDTNSYNNNSSRLAQARNIPSLSLDFSPKKGPALTRVRSDRSSLDSMPESGSPSPLAPLDVLTPAAAAAAVAKLSKKPAAERLAELRGLRDANLITPEQYDAQEAVIIASI